MHGENDVAATSVRDDPDGIAHGLARRQRDIVIEQTALPGRFGAGRFCSQLSGEVTQPTIITLTGDENTCLYFPVKDGDPTPALAVDGSDFSAGCPLD